jgi:hypothetical protein
MVSVSLPESVELALIIASLTPLGRESGGSIDRNGAYFAAVEAHFGSHAAHPAVTHLGSEFNLPRFVGNAADFSFDATGALVESDSSGSLWGDRHNDLFRNDLESVRRFAEDTSFRRFFAAQAQLYAALVATTRAFVDPVDMRGWLDANFAARPGPVRIYVSPLMAGHHWTTLDKPEQRLWISAPRAPTKTVSRLDQLRYGRSIFTELDHAYVNPVTARHAQAVRGALGDRRMWADERASRNYPTPELLFNEYMTYAVFLMYAADRLEDDELVALADHLSDLMVKSRGFIAFDRFAEEALARYRSRGGAAAESLIAPMIAWCRRQGSS